MATTCSMTRVLRLFKRISSVDLESKIAFYLARLPPVLPELLASMVAKLEASQFLMLRTYWITQYCSIHTAFSVCQTRALKNEQIIEIVGNGESKCVSAVTACEIDV